MKYVEQLRDQHGGIRILLSAVWVIFCLSILHLTTENWTTIPRALRAAGLVSITAGFYGWGLRSYLRGQPLTITLPPPLGSRRFAWNTRAQATCAWLAGYLFLGTSILKICRMYHGQQAGLNEHTPYNYLWLALGSLPFAALSRSRLLTLLSLAAGALAVWSGWALGLSP